ncbi:formylglycine-generating enzyme family protein [Mucilaginibacter myungsuensis]|uniref:SUMF1/EgtB/PvdO family nonheme iron enzyme n=1 Tax=Mucilaginibacter myungsuensis TaxID=649104 RepID=A0A929PY20_9SPHI|nr:SUMF1/EgtB/PvdO family nonheme iron enzyme [Mucilaginibacter myungsuensis]MBE9663724.1 SUMF1/EgtB/PvdO family nonheme iron enzyme [Mucilaginibacter myungsuensis]MDN3598952.1 SUMF1/EgtB/PvdO family nonheme iron enzyme [Mucilaginibacter myungsuensis]
MRSRISILSILLLSAVSATAQEKPKNYKQDIDGTKLSFEMTGIPGGQFVMGSKKGKPDEKPVHTVSVAPFWIGTYEVIWDIYEPFLYKDFEVTHNVGAVPANVDAVTRPTKPYLDMTFGMGKEGQPALAMTHYNAIQFCKWLYARTGVFYRLPTEAEWEYAARAGTTTEYFFGDNAGKLGDYAWIASNSDAKTHKVGEKKPNPWGLYDIYGNVAEWTYDQYLPEFYASVKDKSADPVAKPEKLYPNVVRGGAYNDEAKDARSAARTASDPAWKQLDPQIPKSNWWFPEAPFVGLRLVRPSVTPSKEAIDAYYDKAPIKDF